MSAGLGAIVARLLFVQGINAATYQADARSEYVHEFSFLGERGAILDRNGNELAMSVPMTTVFGDPYQVTNPGQEARAFPWRSAYLSPPCRPTSASRAALSTSPGRSLTRRRRRSKNWSTTASVPGVYTMQEPKRFDPAGQLAAPLIGMVGTDGTGLSGLEYKYNSLLEGKPGKLVEDMDPAGGQIPGGLQEYQAPVRGDDLVLSIDEPLQYDAEQALARAIVAAQADSGIALIMNSRTGELLAVAQLTMPSRSEPTTMSEPPALPVWFVPPGAVSGHGASVASAQPVEAPSASAFTTVYEPGSVEKLVTVSAALSTEAVQPNDYFSIPDTYDVAGTMFSDAWVHPTLDWSIPNIIAHSSDIGTIEIAQRMGMPELVKYIHAFGIGQRTDIDFPGESAGIVPGAVAVVGHLDSHRPDRPGHCGHRSANARRLQHDRKWRHVRTAPSRRRLRRRGRDGAPVPGSAPSQGGQHDGREGDDLDARRSCPGRDGNGRKPRALHRRRQDRAPRCCLCRAAVTATTISYRVLPASSRRRTRP